MDKINEFKSFISNHPEILKYIKNKEMSFQDFYEIYDIYGEDMNMWNKYFSNGFSITDKIKNINLDNAKKHINNAEKAIGILQELTKKDISEPIKKVTEPLTKFYGD